MTVQEWVKACNNEERIHFLFDGKVTSYPARSTSLVVREEGNEFVDIGHSTISLSECSGHGGDIARKQIRELQRQFDL